MYYRLFNIRIVHDYYKNGICNGLIIKPTYECLKTIRNHRLLFKPTLQGVQILYPSGSNSGDPLIDLSDVLLTFTITSNQYAELLTITDLDVDSLEYSGKKIIYFINDPVDEKSIRHKFIDYIKSSVFNYKLPFKAVNVDSDTASLEISDSKGEIVSGPFHSIKPGKDGYYYQPINLSAFREEKYTFRSGDTNNTPVSELIFINNQLSRLPVFGLLEIYFKPGSLNEYDLNFSRRSSVWKYFIINKSGTVDFDSYRLEIKDTNNDADFPYNKSYVFKKGPQPDPVIRINGYDTVAFSSADSIPFYERPLLNIELQKVDKTHGSEGNKITLIKHLPNPKSSGIINKDKESEIYVFI